MGGVALVDGGDGGTGCCWCSGWRLLAHQHAGLAVAAAGGGEGGMRERDVCQAQGDRRPPRDFDPSRSDLPILHFGPSLLFFWLK